MAINLRLLPELHEAVKSRAASSGRSQQDVIRDAIEAYLQPGNSPGSSEASRDEMILRPARAPLRRAASRLRLPSGTHSLELLDREDRL